MIREKFARLKDAFLPAAKIPRLRRLEKIVASLESEIAAVRFETATAKSKLELLRKRRRKIEAGTKAQAAESPVEAAPRRPRGREVAAAEGGAPAAPRLRGRDLVVAEFNRQAAALERPAFDPAKSSPEARAARSKFTGIDRVAASINEQFGVFDVRNIPPRRPTETPAEIFTRQLSGKGETG